MRRSHVLVMSVLVAGLLLVGGGIATAQTQTGAVNGTVKDPNGDAVPGVTVTVTGSALMGSRTDVTGSGGEFRFPSLPPGDDYTLTFELQNFSKVVREQIRVLVGQTTTMTVGMALAGVQKEITVIGETPMVDITSPTSSTNYGTDLLTNIPNNRDWSAAVKQMPGIVSGDKAGYGPMYSARGGSVVNNETAFDGVANSNPVYHTAGHSIVYEAIEEVQVVDGALPAELGNVAGSYINIVTKSGGNEFHGDAAYYYESNSLQSDNLSSTLRDQGVESAPELTDYEDWSANVGGPILRDTIWFNVGYWKRNEAHLATGFPFDDRQDTYTYFGKVTWQPASDHNFMAMYNKWKFFQPYYPATQFYAPEATNVDRDETELAKIRWTGVLSENAFVEADWATAKTSTGLLAQPDAGTAYREYLTNDQFGGPFNTQYNDSTRDQGNVSLSLFKDGWQGSHAFKVGVQYERSDFIWDNFNNLAPFSQLYLLGGAPFLAFFYNIPQGGHVYTNTDMKLLNAYVQDRWTVSDRVTLSLGVRMDHSEGIYPAAHADGYTYGAFVNFPAVDNSREKVIDWTALEPRLGATISLDEEGKTALRIGVSRYHHALNISEFLLANPNSLAYSLNLWVDLNGDLFADPGEVLYPIVTGGGAFNSVDPGLEQPYTDEVTVGFERELFTDFSVKVNATWRRDKRLIDDFNLALDENSYVPVDVPDPGPDSVLGTADDRTLTMYNQVANFDAQLLITNPSLAKRDYKGVEVVATKRLSHKWQALGSVVWSRATGTLGTDIDSSTGWSDGFNNANSLINLSGPLSLDREWQLKLVGTYLAPLGFSVSGYWQYQTGVPLYRFYSVTGFNQGTASAIADPRDSHRLDDFSQLDLRLEKQFSFGSRPIQLGILLDVFNLLNESNVTSRYSGTGTYDAAAGTYTQGAYPFDNPLTIQAPRIVRLGAKLTF